MAPHAPLPKTYVLSSHYISLARCAQDYRRMLEQLGCLATCPDEADVIFLHSTLGQAWPTLMATPGFADRYLVGYLVWEADRLAQKNLRLLPLFDAIWTPSWYSARSFVPHHERVRWLPHVIRPAKVPSPQAIAQLESVLGPPGPCELLQIGRPHDPRKAFTEAAQAAQAAAYGRPGLTLVQKVMLAETDASASPVARRQGAVVELTGHFDEDLMAALYARAHYVFSNHHSEGWGLTLSEGMAAGTPAIASNYSGNLTYMGPQSNILIDGVESEVRDLDRSESFEAPMRWHNALPGHIEQAIGRAYDMVGSPEYEAMAQQGRRIGKVYDERHVRLMMRKLLMDIADAQRAGERPRPKDLLGLQRIKM